MKVAYLIPALTIALLLTLSVGGARGDINQDPMSGNWLVRTDSVSYNYLPLTDSMMTLSQVGVSPSGTIKQVIFASVLATSFNPSQNPVHPVEEGRTVFVRGLNATLETHDNPHAMLLYRVAQPGTITFTLDSRIGAISFGSSALIGDAQIQADLAVTNGRAISKSVDSLFLQMQPSDLVTFRVQGPAGSIASLLSSGAVGVEIDLRAIGAVLDADIIPYTAGASLTTDTVATSRAQFSFSGLASSRVVIIDLSRDLYTPLRDHMSVSVGGSTLAKFSSVEELETASGPGYFVAEGQGYTEMLVRTDASSGSLVIESIVPGFDWFLAAAALASVVVSVAAGAYLFRRRSQ